MNGVAAGYARALFQVAEKKDVLALVLEELTQLEGLLREHARFFENPIVPAERQAGALLSVLEGQAHPLTAQFLARLALDRRLRLLPRVRMMYASMAEAALGKVKVILSVRYKPGEQRLRALRGVLGQYGLYPPEKRDTAVFEIVIDESILGGFVAECRGRLLDASLRTRLEKLFA